MLIQNKRLRFLPICKCDKGAFWLRTCAVAQSDKVALDYLIKKCVQLFESFDWFSRGYSNTLPSVSQMRSKYFKKSLAFSLFFHYFLIIISLFLQ